MKKLILLLVITSSLFMVSCSHTDHSGDIKRRVHPAWFYAISNGGDGKYHAYETIDVKWVDTMYRNGDIITVDGDDFIVCDSCTENTSK